MINKQGIQKLLFQREYMLIKHICLQIQRVADVVVISQIIIIFVFFLKTGAKNK